MWETVIQKLELNFQLDKIVDFLFFFNIFESTLMISNLFKYLIN